MPMQRPAGRAPFLPDMAVATDKNPELVRLETLMACADRRLKRAQQRLERAQQEVREAQSDVLRTQMERRAWLQDNPQPQHELEV